MLVLERVAVLQMVGLVADSEANLVGTEVALVAVDRSRIHPAAVVVVDLD